MKFFPIKSRLICCLVGNVALLLLLAFFFQGTLQNLKRFSPLAHARTLQAESLTLLPALLQVMDSQLRIYSQSLSAPDLNHFNEEQNQVAANLAGLDNIHVNPTQAEQNRQALAQRWLNEIGRKIWPQEKNQPAALPPEQIRPLLQQSQDLISQFTQATQIAQSDNALALHGLQNEQSEEIQDHTTLMWILVDTVILFTVIVQLAVSNSIIYPLNRLAKAATRWRQGDYSTRVKIRSADEIQTLSDILNEMADSIEANQNMQHQAQTFLEDRVREKTQELEEKNVKLREAARQKDQFMATLSHELRTPLTPILSSTHLLAEMDLPPTESQKTVQVIERNARALSRMIDELLDLSAVMNQKLYLLREKIVINDWAQATLRALEPLWLKKNLQLTFIPIPEPVTLEIDTSRLSQVLTNLLTNAIKFTPPGGSITVELQALPEEIHCVVRDTGAGLEAEELERVFEMFHQAQSGLTGLGVGLTVARTLAELHGGGLTVQSEGLGLGSTFTLWLPRQLQLESQPIPQPRLNRHTSKIQIPPSARDILRGKRILLVEDTADTRDILARILERRGFTVWLAEHGRQGLAMARQQHPEIILSDIGMPEMNGLEMMQQLRRDPHQRELVAIALSGFGGEQDTEAALAAGFNAHLVKPIDINFLEHILIQAFQADR